MKYTIEILVIYILNIDKNIEVFKEFCEKLIVFMNNLYNSNNYLYFNNSIIKRVYSITSSESLIFSKIDETNLINISKFIDCENKIFTTHEGLLLFLVNNNYHIIKLAKIFLKIYFEKKTNNLLVITNLLKELIQNQLSMYVRSKTQISVKNADSLTKGEELKEDSQINTPLIMIRKVDKILHLGVKKFLVKSLKHCLY